MSLPPDEIRKRLLFDFPDADISIENSSGDQDHYAITLKDASFQGIPIVQQHQRVYRALCRKGDLPIHAVSLKTSA